MAKTVFCFVNAAVTIHTFSQSWNSFFTLNFSFAYTFLHLKVDGSTEITLSLSPLNTYNFFTLL